MSFRDVAICISSLDPGYGLVAQASAIVEGWDAHLSCCAIGLQPMPVFTGGFAGGYAEYQALSQAAQESIFSFRARLNDYIQNKGIKVEMRETQTFDSALALSAAVFARYADLLIATMPATPDKAHHGEIIEGALFNAGRPILALPNNWNYRPLGKRILLAWGRCIDMRPLGSASNTSAQVGSITSSSRTMCIGKRRGGSPNSSGKSARPAIGIWMAVM